MLELRNIVKTYKTGDNVVSALDDVSICFRENEFVSVLGASGCGKTTLLNIVGGLDRYTSGDLIINGKSTKQFRDRDWDTYRNHSIGFVFQSYNLIPHQTVLANVELALTLSGVSKHERRRRAMEALDKVGLVDQLHKKPNQMSGGQMQRVAIARALVNNPDILLADEPTGALDTQTSVQIMELLKEVAKDRLVVMVTHNPDLAEEYSTRIVRLSDGKVIDDSNPISEEEYNSLAEKDRAAIIEAKKDKKAQKVKAKKSSMSFATAVSLSFKNLLTKKGRTIMTSFAGSIGIIGIALILALSNGIQLFIDQVQEDTLSTYPLTIQKETSDLSAMMSAMTEVEADENTPRDPNKIYVDDSMDKMVDAMLSTTKNDLVSFKKHLDENYSKLEPFISDIQYTYDMNLQVYSIVPDKDENDKEYNRVTKLGLGQMLDSMGNGFEGLGSLASTSGMMDVMTEMIDNEQLINQQYEKIAGEWPKADNEIVLVVSKNNKLSKMTLYMLGILDQGELEDVMKELLTNNNVTTKDQVIDPFDFDDFLNMEFYIVNTPDFFEKTDKTYPYDGTNYNIWKDARDDISYDEENFIKTHGTKLKISGIIRPRVDATATSISSPLAYTRKLTDKILAANESSEVINQQKKTPDINVTTGLGFERTKYTPETIHELIEKIDDNTMEQFYAYMTEMIKTDERFSAQLDVKDAESFQNVFFLLPMENKVELVSSMLAAAKANPANTMGLAMLCGTLNSMFDQSVAGAYNVTVDTIPTLMPVMSMQQLYVLINGVPKSDKVPMDISGLLSLTDSNTMTAIYSGVSEALKNMTVTDEIFSAIVSGFPADSEEFIELEERLYDFAPQKDATYDSTLEKLGNAIKSSPASINFYAKDFDSKAEVEKFIKDYNTMIETKTENGEYKDIENPPTTIEYTDIIGVMMSSVSIIIDVISYVLIAFVSISLVVSSIMIGIITNISVLERTKEIGILRAIGASKKDISRVFNAETLIIGLAAGIIGILTTILLCIPTNAIIQGLTGFKNINAVLPPVGGAILVAISMLLTIIAGLIPARKASKKDPVIALRTE